MRDRGGWTLESGTKRLRSLMGDRMELEERKKEAKSYLGTG